MAIGTRLKSLERRCLPPGEIDGDYLHDWYKAILTAATPEEREAIHMLARVTHNQEARAKLGGILGEVGKRINPRGNR